MSSHFSLRRVLIVLGWILAFACVFGASAFIVARALLEYFSTRSPITL